MWADIRWQRPDFPKFPKLATICLSIPVTRVLTKLGLKLHRDATASVVSLVCKTKHCKTMLPATAPVSTDWWCYQLKQLLVIHTGSWEVDLDLSSLSVTNCNAVCFDLTANDDLFPLGYQSRFFVMTFRLHQATYMGSCAGHFHRGLDFKWHLPVSIVFPWKTDPPC